MTREDRKKKRIRQLRIRVCFFCVVLAALIGLIFIWTMSRQDNDKEPQIKEVHDEIQGEQADEKSELNEVREKAVKAGAPEEILELLDKNPETIDFVANYAELKDVPPADTIGESLEEGTVPHLLQWDSKWGYQTYGDSTIAASGCGPTCLAMVIVGLTGDTTVTPYVLSKYSEDMGYAVEGGGTYANFMCETLDEWGIEAAESLESEKFLQDEMAEGKVIVCNLNPGKYFTDVGHFIVITGYENGVITVLDPFSIENTEKEWNYSDIKEQVAGLYSYALKK